MCQGLHLGDGVQERSFGVRDPAPRLKRGHRLGVWADLHTDRLTCTLNMVVLADDYSLGFVLACTVISVHDPQFFSDGVLQAAIGPNPSKALMDLAILTHWVVVPAHPNWLQT